MAETRQTELDRDVDAEITLGILSAVEEDARATQRSLASDLGIALGLTNAYLKKCVKKGLIKVTQAPANRYAYYLTPKGFAEKSRLTAEYLAVSFNFFRAAREQCADVIAGCAARGQRRVLLAGVSDLAEIATLCAADAGIDLVAILDPASSESRYAGLDVISALADAPVFDAVVVTDFRTAQQTFDRLSEEIDPDRVHAPALLKISRARPVLADDEADA